MRRLSAGPLIAEPSRNCAWVHTEATVVISLIVTVAGEVATYHCHQRNGRIVAALRIGFGLAALRDQIKRGSCRVPSVELSVKLPSAPVRA